MKTNITTLNCSFVGVVCAGALLLTAASVSAQNLFVSDYNAGNVYQYTPGGTQSTFATGMNHPYGIAFNAAGNLFVANTDQNVPSGGNITEITRGGTQSIFFSGIDPIALAFNNAGTLFAADYKSGNIYEYTSSGVQSTFASGFTTPLALTFDSTGDLFVGSGYGDGNGIITKITPGGTQSPFASGLNFIGGLTFDGNNLLVTEVDTGTIYQYTAGGAQSTFATVNTSGLGALAFDNAGNLFVETEHSVVEIAPGGGQSTFATGLSIASGLTFQPVPEPSTFALIGIGAAAFLARRRISSAKN
jgi:sugar lactone lactonase YvrE